MQTDDPRNLELKKIFFVSAVLFLLFETTAFGAQKGSPKTAAPKKKAETTEQKGRVDGYLASQEKGHKVQGDVLKKPLEVNSEKPLHKKLETHPPKSFHSKTPEKAKIEAPLNAKKVPPKSIQGKPLGMKEKSRFKPNLIQKQLYKSK